MNSGLWEFGHRALKAGILAILRRVSRTPEACRDISFFLPGVRKKRLPLAKFLAPLRGAHDLDISQG